MIAYSLLKHENRDFPNYIKNNYIVEDLLKETARFKDQWYRYLVHDLFSGCNVDEKIFCNKIDIVTFNYDVSLDCFICCQILNTEFFKEIKNQEIEDKFITQKIHHVYGQLHLVEDIQKNYGNYNDWDDNKGGLIQEKNMQRFIRALKIHENIKIIGEARTQDQNQKIRQKIEDAQEIIIIGFGFDADNLLTLGFGGNLSDYVSLLNYKTIKYLNFDGQINNIDRDFKIIHDHNNNVNIIPSAAKSIISAYQHDFRISLFQGTRNFVTESKKAKKALELS